MSSRRAALRALILSDAQLTSEIPANRWAARGSLAVDAPDRPFAVIASLNDLPFARGVRRANAPQDFEIWIHDDSGSYVRIDKIIQRLQDFLDEATHFVWEGFRISQIDLQGVGPDLSDDVLRTLTRSLRVRVLGDRV